MSDVNNRAYGARLVQRLDEAAKRNEKSLKTDELALGKLAKVLPILEKDLQGNQMVLAAIREIYSVLEADGEERQSTIMEIKEARDLLEISTNLLEQAGFDIANIQTFSNDEIWLGDHLPTIKRAIDIFNIQKLEVALDEADKERFEDIAHAVRRSGKKREKAAATGV